MTRQKWTSKEQEAWLEKLKPTFLAANQAKTALKTFFPMVLKEFREKWPVPPPTQAEIDNVKSYDFAVVVKKRQYDKRTSAWFHNNCRAPTSDTTRGVLKIKAPTQRRKLQPWQVYHSMTYETVWKTHINKLWTDYKAKWTAENGNVPPPKRRFEIMAEFMRARYKEASSEMKEKVEKYRNEIKEEVRDSSPDGANKVNLGYQEAINMLPRTLMNICDSLMKQTGWHITVLAGGPSPESGGALLTFLSHGGRTKSNQNFQQFLGAKDYDEYLLAPFERFLRASFTPEDCAARSLTNSGGKESTNQLDSGEQTDEEWVKENGMDLDDNEVEKAGEDSDRDAEGSDEEDGDGNKENANTEVAKPKGGISEYELNKLKNVAEVKKMLSQLDEQFPLPEEFTKKSQKANPASRKKGEKATELTERRQSMRNKASSTPDALPPIIAATATASNQGITPALVTAPSPSPSPSHEESAENTLTSIITEQQVPSTVAKSSTSDSSPKKRYSAVASIVHDVLCGSPLSAKHASAADKTTEDVSPPVPGDTAAVIISSTNISAVEIIAASPADNPVPTTSDSPANISVPTARDNSVHIPTPAASDNATDTPVPITSDSTTLTSGPVAPPSPVLDTDEQETPPSKPALKTTVSPTVPSASTIQVDVDLPNWLQAMIKFLCDAALDNAWQDLITEFVEYEKGKPPSGNLPTKLRPKEVSAWIKSKKKDIVPPVDPLDYGNRFLQWWRKMQPSWRLENADSGIPRFRDVPKGESWQGLKKGGTAGIYVVVIGLSWWIIAQRVVYDINAWAAVDDICWVIKEMKKDESDTVPSPLKRARDGSDDTESGHKKKSRLSN